MAMGYISLTFPLGSCCTLKMSKYIDAAATAVGEIDVVVTVMVLHELSFDASELATADASTAVMLHFGRVQSEQSFVIWQRLCQITTAPA